MDQDSDTETLELSMDDDETPTNAVKVEPSTSQSQQAAMDKVFGDDRLRKKMLEQVIYSDFTHPKRVNYADLPNIRVVQKSWLSTTSAILLERRDPLYNFSQDFSYLPSFVEMITHSKRSKQLIPPFSVTIKSDFFIQENYKILEKFLVTCAPRLTSLLLIIPKNCSMSFILPQFSLSILQQLTMEFTMHSHPANAVHHATHQNTTVSLFIQQLLNSSSELKTLEFRTPSDVADSSVVPGELEMLSIPETVTTLRMKCPFLAGHLNMIIPSNNTSNYAHLTELEILASEVPMTENTIYNILTRHCTTLKILKLSGKHDFTDIIQPTMFRVPEMKNLEKLIVSSSIWNCTDDFQMNSLSFPKLTTAKMERISVSLFQKLTNPARTKLRFVTNVKVSLVNELLPEEYFDSSVTLDKEKMERIHWSFRNVTKLSITISGTETSGLKYIFLEMIKLTSLSVDVKRTIPAFSRDQFEGLMIGVPGGIANGLWNNPGFWGSCEVKQNVNNYPSITRLQELVKLRLTTVNCPIFYDFNSGMRGRLLSEVTFHFAFFRMPQLKHLHLYGLFDPSDAMISLWRDQKESVGAEPIVHGLERYP